jgi:hypothetical protein
MPLLARLPVSWQTRDMTELLENNVGKSPAHQPTKWQGGVI